MSFQPTHHRIFETLDKNHRPHATTFIEAPHIAISFSRPFGKGLGSFFDMMGWFDFEGVKSRGMFRVGVEGGLAVGVEIDGLGWGGVPPFLSHKDGLRVLSVWPVDFWRHPLRTQWITSNDGAFSSLRVFPVYLDELGGVVIPTPQLQVRFRAKPSRKRLQHLAEARDLLGIRKRSKAGLFVFACKPKRQAAETQEMTVEALLTMKEDPEAWFEIARQMMLEESDIEHCAPDILWTLHQSNDLLGVDRQTFTAGTHQQMTAKNRHFAQLGISDAWEMSKGQGVVVAVVDDGVDDKHPNLIGQLALDHAYDFQQENSDARPKVFRLPYHDPAHNDIHGTPCAGLIVSNGNEGVWGVAPKSQVLPIRVSNKANGLVLVATHLLCDALTQAAEHARVIVCSWYLGGYDTLVEDTLQRITEGMGGQQSVIVVAAAGNDAADRLRFPASSSFAVGVGAVDLSGQHIPKSNKGAGLNLVAVGGSLWTTDVQIHPAYGYSPGSLFTQFGGTSSATAVVSGVIALMLSVCSRLTFGEVLEILQETAEREGVGEALKQADPEKWASRYGTGRVHAHRALCEVLRRYPPPSTEP